MSFVKLSIFGTSFEVQLLVKFPTPFINRSAQLLGHNKICRSPTSWNGWALRSIPISIVANARCKVHLGSSGKFGECLVTKTFLTVCARQFEQGPTYGRVCGDQEDHEAIQHPGAEQKNVPGAQTSQAHPTWKCECLSLLRLRCSLFRSTNLITPRLSASATSSFLPSRICQFSLESIGRFLDESCGRYFVTELLGTDLHRLLTSRPLEKQFIQYFLYQILVRSSCLFSYRADSDHDTFDSVASSMCTQLAWFIVTLYAIFFLPSKSRLSFNS